MKDRKREVRLSRWTQDALVALSAWYDGDIFIALSAAIADACEAKGIQVRRPPQVEFAVLRRLDDKLPGAATVVEPRADPNRKPRRRGRWYHRYQTPNGPSLAAEIEFYFQEVCADPARKARADLELAGLVAYDVPPSSRPSSYLSPRGWPVDEAMNCSLKRGYPFTTSPARKPRPSGRGGSAAPFGVAG